MDLDPARGSSAKPCRVVKQHAALIAVSRPGLRTFQR